MSPISPMSQISPASPIPRPAAAPPAPAARVLPAAPRALARKPAADPRVVLARVHAVLADLQAPTNAHWSSFRMTHRLLEKHARIPLSMFHAIHPFLEEILLRLVPDLKSIAPYKGLTEATVGWLEAVCRELRGSDPEPAQLAGEVPQKLERILRVLDALRSLAQSAG
jgi:hypothetical protein